VSASVRPEQVFASIVLFGLIYLLLFAVWILVLNSKIQHGPEPVATPAGTHLEGVVAAAADRVDHESSMTEAKERDR
jgi:cytochrome d ubiquinol oxidase subunit I